MAFPGTGKIWMNGSLVDWEDARSTSRRTSSTTAPASSRARAATTTPSGSACFRLDAHMRRLYRLREDLPDGLPLVDRRADRSAVLETIRANGFKACYIRPLVYRGYDALGVNPLPCPVDAAIMRVGMGRVSRRRGARAGRRRRRQLVDARWRRTRFRRWPRLGQLRQLAADQDGGDARRLQPRASRSTTSGLVSEGSGQNLFLVRDDVHLHAAARRRRSCRASRATSSSRSRGIWASTVREEHAAARVALPRRRGVLRAARPSRSRRSGRSTRSPSATAGAARSPRRSSSGSSTSSTATCPTRTAG